jgi:hypothetical protein
VTDGSHVAGYSTVRIRCRASRPDGASSRDGDARCDTILGDVPGPVRFVRLSTRAPDHPDGQIWLKCGRRDCRTWNVFEVVVPA